MSKLITKRDATIVVSDNGGTNSITIGCEPGDLAYSAPRHSILRPLDRGEHKTPRRQDAQPVTISWTINPENMGSAAASNIVSVCEQRDWVASNWTSTLTGTSDVFAVDVAVTFDRSWAGESDETLTFDDVSLRGSYSDGDPSSYSITGEASILAPSFS